MRKLLIISIVLSTFLYGEKMTGKRLLDKAIDVMNPEDSKATLIQTIQTTTGETRTLKYESYSAEEGKYTLMRYQEPARVRGNALMMKNYANDIWMYNRRTRRVRKLASHAKRQNFEGSDFTYEDMGTGDSWKEDYDPENQGKETIDNTECYHLSCTPKENADVAYSKMVVWLRTSDYYPVLIDYYKDGKLFKKLLIKNIENIEGHPTARKMVMKNVQENSQTIMEYEDITYNVDLDKSYFTERRLRR
ncbi:MAG: outer membrane lipoprotein-sorting protein [Candidatus Marinimicrobia bacterium]|nr:outer membrane lipoprotein-sorting protein [Candidatus Neomarinimicrobiota bacterium]